MSGALPVSAGGVGVRCSGVVHIWSSGREEVVAVRGVDLDVAPGERVALLGPSGSGKSTLLALLGGLLRPSAGQLWIGSTEISRLSERALLRLRSDRVGVVLQGAARNLLPYATPLQNMRFAQRSMRRRTRRRVLAPSAMLDELGLAAVADTPLARLSGGEQQRVALAVAVANGPGLLLADEPTSQLDSDGRDRVLAMMARVNERFGTTVVVVTHDPEVGTALGRTVGIRAGRVGHEGRLGRSSAVVGTDGSVQLPEAVLAAWPAGTLVDVVVDGETLRLLRRPADEESG